MINFENNWVLPLQGEPWSFKGGHTHSHQSIPKLRVRTFGPVGLTRGVSSPAFTGEFKGTQEGKALLSTRSAINSNKKIFSELSFTMRWTARLIAAR